MLIWGLVGLLIYGAGGFGREIAWLAAELFSLPASSESPSAEALGFIDDGAIESTVNGLPVFDLATATARFPEASVFIAVGSGELREKLASRATAVGLSASRPLIAPTVRMSAWNQIGDGSCLCDGCIVTVNVTLGEHVQVNVDCTIGHDAVLEDYVTLAPGVHVSGWVRIERGAYIGTGVNIINGIAEKPLVIGERAVVGAGACVIGDVPPHTTVVGVPAKSVTSRRDRRA